MKRVSMMTMTLFMRLMFKFKLDHDMDDMLEGYEEMLDLVSEGGFRWVDVTSWEIGILGVQNVAEQLKKHNLRVSSIVHPDMFEAGGDAETAERIEKAKQLVDVAATLGCDVFMIVPQTHPGIEDEDAALLHERLAAHCLPIVAYSKERGVHVVIEDTPELNLQLCKAADVKAVLDRVEGLELVYDSGNMLLCGEKPISYIDPFVGRVGYVHLKDMRPAPVGSMMMDLDKDGNPMSSAPIGTGLVDLPAVTKKLKEIGYDGSYSVEFFVDDDRDYLKSIRRTKEYVTDTLAL